MCLALLANGLNLDVAQLFVLWNASSCITHYLFGEREKFYDPEVCQCLSALSSVCDL